MHEVSIVSSIIRTLEIEFDKKELQNLKTIYLKIGVLSNIEPRLLYNAYNAYCTSASNFRNVSLQIENTQIKIKCNLCKHITEVQKYVFSCEKCNAPCKNIIQGEEMLIHKVEFKD